MAQQAAYLHRSSLGCAVRRPGSGVAMVEGRLGRPPLAAKREQFGRLIARGVGNAEACRIVGVRPKTGKRWRLGRVMTSSSGARRHYAPVVSARRQVISGRYLSDDDRLSIADLVGAGLARQLGSRVGWRFFLALAGQSVSHCRGVTYSRRHGKTRLARRRHL